MRVLSRSVAALLLATVATPWIFAFVPSCCERHTPIQRVVTHHARVPRIGTHHCDHNDAQAVAPTGNSSMTSQPCGICTCMIAARDERRLPKVNFSRLPVEKRISLAVIPLRFSLPSCSDRTPHDAAVRRATLCSFLI